MSPKYLPCLKSRGVQVLMALGGGKHPFRGLPRTWAVRAGAAPARPCV